MKYLRRIRCWFVGHLWQFHDVFHDKCMSCGKCRETFPMKRSLNREMP